MKCLPIFRCSGDSNVILGNFGTLILIRKWRDLHAPLAFFDVSDFRHSGIVLTLSGPGGEGLEARMTKLAATDQKPLIL